MSIRPRYAFSVVTTFVTFFVWSAAQSDAQDWPRWRGPHFDGVSRETALLNPWPKEGPRQIWQVKLSGGFSTVAVADGRLYTQTKEENHEVVLCLDAATGKELWRHRYAVNYGAHVTFTSRPRPDSRTGPGDQDRKGDWAAANVAARGQVPHRRPQEHLSAGPASVA